MFGSFTNARSAGADFAAETSSLATVLAVEDSGKFSSSQSARRRGPKSFQRYMEISGEEIPRIAVSQNLPEN
jgi:hypothetical protein